MGRKKNKQQKKTRGVRQSSGGSKSTNKRNKRIIESDSDEDHSDVNDSHQSEAGSRNEKARKKRKSNTKKKSVEADEVIGEDDNLLLDLNEDKNGGKESFEEEMRRLGLGADADLMNNSNNSKTGVSYITMYRCQRITEYLNVRKEWKECEEFAKEKDALRDEMTAMRTPGTWQYKFRIKNVDGENVLQRASNEFNKTVNKKLSTVQRRRLMEEKDWVNVLCIDDPDFFEKVNDVHWSDDPKRHLKGVMLYNACLDVMSSNINNDICSLLTKHCKVCQVAVKRYMKKKKKQVIAEESKTYVHVNLLHLDIVLSNDVRDVFSHLVTVIYNNGFTDFISIKGHSAESIAGHLYHSFSRNTLPMELKFVYANGSRSTRNGCDQDMKHSLVDFEKSILTFLNHGLSENCKIRSKQGESEKCDEMEYSVSFLLDCFLAHNQNVKMDNFVMFLSMMNEHINRNLKFHEYRKETFEVDPKKYANEFLSVRFPKSNLRLEGSGQLGRLNEDVQVDQSLQSNAIIETPVKRNTAMTTVLDVGDNLLQKIASGSVVRNLEIPRIEHELNGPSEDIDGSSEDLDMVIEDTAKNMADHFIDDLLNNSTFDTEATDLSSLPLVMPSTVSGLKKSPAFLVPVENTGNQCYAIAVLQLLQLMPYLWSDMITSLAEEGVMFEDVCEQRPTSFALLMFGSKLKDEYLKKLKELKEPSHILHATWRMWQSHDGIMSRDDQEDATEFLIVMLEGIWKENRGNDAVLRSMTSHFFYNSRMRY